jgi:hypothetical protein
MLALLGIAALVLGRDDDRGRRGRLAVFEAQRHLALGIRLEERRASRVAVGGHALQDLVAVIERGRHQLGSLVDREAEHDPLVAGALVLVARCIDALGDVRGLAVEVVFEARTLPVEAGLLIANALDRVADDLLDLVARARRPPVSVGELLLVIDAAAADLAAQHDALGGDHGFAGNPSFGILGQEQVDDGVADLVGDLVGMTLGNGFGREEVIAAHVTK